MQSDRWLTGLSIAQGHLELKAGQLEGHLVVDGEVVAFDHSVDGLAVKQRHLGRVLRHLTRATEKAPAEDEATLEGRRWFGRSRGPGRRRHGSPQFATAAADGAADTVPDAIADAVTAAGAAWAGCVLRRSLVANFPRR